MWYPGREKSDKGDSMKKVTTVAAGFMIPVIMAWAYGSGGYDIQSSDESSGYGSGMQMGKKKRGGGRNRRQRRGNPMKDFIKTIYSELKLSDSQKTKINEILDELREKRVQEIRRSRREKRFAKIKKRDKIDALQYINIEKFEKDEFKKAVISMSEKIRKEREERMKKGVDEMAEAIEKVYEVLNKEQRKRLLELSAGKKSAEL